MKQKYILGNWKMHGTAAEAEALAMAIARFHAPAGVHVALFPPAPLLNTVQVSIAGSQLQLGAQDVSPEKNGAFTGDVSASILKDAGCAYVIVGHSERRTGHEESDSLVNRKAQAAWATGLIPVICVGENLAQRESGEYLKIIQSQVENSLPGQIHGRFIVAYEPVWAIGSGRTPTLAQICEVHKTIESMLSYATSGARAPIVYGGSVKADNAREILIAERVDGVLVGGASLKAEEFCAIIAAAH